MYELPWDRAVIARNKHEWTSENILFQLRKNISTHYFSSSSPPTLIYSPVCFVCRTKWQIWYYDRLSMKPWWRVNCAKSEGCCYQSFCCIQLVMWSQHGGPHEPQPNLSRIQLFLNISNVILISLVLKHLHTLWAVLIVIVIWLSVAFQ